MKSILTIMIWMWVLAIIGFTNCNRNEIETPQEEIQTAKPIFDKNCFTVCNINKNPDLRLVTNAQEERPLLPDGTIDSLSYFWLNYHVRTQQIRLTQNYLTPGFYTMRYGWDSGVVVNRVRLQCLVENIAPFNNSCINDWEFYESQGYIQDSTEGYYFDGLFQFDTYEKGNGNNWKFLYSDFKKSFFPSVVPQVNYIYNTDFCYYDRGIPAQTGDFYYNYFRFPNHDGIYRLVIRFNPLIKGCRAVKETDYTNNEETVTLQILNGTILIIKN